MEPNIGTRTNLVMRSRYQSVLRASRDPASIIKFVDDADLAIESGKIMVPRQIEIQRFLGALWSSGFLDSLAEELIFQKVSPSAQQIEAGFEDVQSS